MNKRRKSSSNSSLFLLLLSSLVSDQLSVGFFQPRPSARYHKTNSISYGSIFCATLNSIIQSGKVAAKKKKLKKKPRVETLCEKKESKSEKAVKAKQEDGGI